GQGEQVAGPLPLWAERPPEAVSRPRRQVPPEFPAVLPVLAASRLLVESRHPAEKEAALPGRQKTSDSSEAEQAFADSRVSAEEACLPDNRPRRDIRASSAASASSSVGSDTPRVEEESALARAESALRTKPLLHSCSP